MSCLILINCKDVLSQFSQHKIKMYTVLGEGICNQNHSKQNDYVKNGTYKYLIIETYHYRNWVFILMFCSELDPSRWDWLLSSNDLGSEDKHSCGCVHCVHWQRDLCWECPPSCCSEAVSKGKTNSSILSPNKAQFSNIHCFSKRKILTVYNTSTGLNST